MDKTKIEKLALCACGIILAFVAFSILAQPNQAMDEDLGRHIKLGEIIWQTKSVPTVNLFSYTHPNFPFINHHWLSEVVFYLLWAMGGPISISILKILLIAGALAIAFVAAAKRGGALPALLSTAFLLPLIGERNGERPEIFAFFLFALLSFILFISDLSPKKKLIVVPLIILLWVNLHLSFIYGLLLIGAWVVLGVLDTLILAHRKHGFWETCGARRRSPSTTFSEKWCWARQEEFSSKENIPAPKIPASYALHPEHIRNRDLKYAIATGIASLLLTAINPNGLAGALYPLTIFSNFGYSVSENMSVLALFGVLRDPLIPYFLFFAPILLTLILWAIVKTKKINVWYVLFFIFACASYAKIRNFPYFVLIGIPAVSLAIREISEIMMEKIEHIRTSFAAAIGIAYLGFLTLLLQVAPPGLSVVESNKEGVDFFLRNNLPGEVFNDFDIGGYLDYRFYPTHKTFVDNRPEAFPKEFFQTYIAVQKNPEIRKKVFDAYGINSIIFSRNDGTSWARAFLAQMPRDPNWKMVYLDDSLVVFTRKTVAKGSP